VSSDAAIFLLLALNAVLVVMYLRLRRRSRRTRYAGRGQKQGWGTVPVRSVYDIFPQFERSELGPLASTAVHHIANDHTPGGISDYESWILCNLAKHAEIIFEFGTATGKTSYLLAANSPAQAVIHTITLAPAAHANYQHELEDTKADLNSALEESAFEHFVYSGTSVEPKINQHLGDSKTFYFEPYRDCVDLAFIDGSHARSYVESDSNNALTILRAGGYLVWHDYRGPDITPGVFAAINSLAKDLPLYQIKGTCMVVYRKPIDH
jgi:hypothetical protein